jgi:hypothetical protein
MMTESNNVLEKKWRTSIIFENTPRGNVIMYYDAYKLGFSFFSDQKVISYDVLNAIAMKYVLIYRCRDFFIDESIVPKKYTSPLLKTHFLEDIKQMYTKETKNTFAKLRDYGKENPNSKIKLITNPEEEKRKNTFIYLGKLNNFQVLQKQPKTKKVLARFSSPLLDALDKNANIQREVFSYKQFKEMQQNVPHETEEAETN